MPCNPFSLVFGNPRHHVALEFEQPQAPRTDGEHVGSGGKSDCVAPCCSPESSECKP